MSKPNLGPSPAQTQERRSAEIIAFPRPPDGRVSREGLQWYVDHPKEAAAEGIAPWQLEAIAYRLRVLDEIAERDRLDPEPVLPPPTDDEIEAALRRDGRPEALRHLEKLGPKPWKWKPAPDVTRREDARDRQDPGPKGERDYGAEPKTSKRKKVKIIMGTSIATRPIAWVWKDWLAHGKLHIFAGRPGCLKTTTAIGLAAGVTVGGKWPDGSRIAQGNVVVWSGEDAIDDTLLPRFIAAGGDRARIAFVKGVEEDGTARGFDPSLDMEALAEVCAELGGVNLIIVDPVVMIAKGDSHKNAETRKDLQPLVDLAERTQAAVIGIHHLTKRSEGANPVDRVSGSLAFGAAPRVILLNALDPKGGAEPRGVLMRAKSNIGPSHGGYAFGAEQRPLESEHKIVAQRILWGEYVDKSASDILEEFEGKTKAAAEKRRKLVEFLTEALTDRGPRMAAEVIAEGEALGFSERALRRALKKLGGTSEKPSFNTGWVWELPELVS
jgi:putative DNA primase/helicase